jgi:oxidoreductase, gfo/idh/mocA family/transferase hexapeptide repeat protein
MINAILIGYGYWGKILEKYILKQNELNLKAIFRGREEKEIIEQVCQKENVDTIFIATPTYTHYSFVEWGLQNKKNVFCEKPLTKTLIETKQLFELAKTKNLILFVDYIYRYSTSINCIKDKLSMIGNIKYINMKISQFGSFYPRDSVTEIIGVHMISVLVFLLYDNISTNEIEIIPYYEQGFQQPLHRMSEIHFGELNIYLEENVFSLNKDRYIEIIGENGIVSFNMFGNNTVRFIKGFWKEGSFIIQDKKDYLFSENDNLEYVIKDFYNIVQHTKKYHYKKQDIMIARILDLFNEMYN